MKLKLKIIFHNLGFWFCTLSFTGLGRSYNETIKHGLFITAFSQCCFLGRTVWSWNRANPFLLVNWITNHCIQSVTTPTVQIIPLRKWGPHLSGAQKPGHSHNTLFSSKDIFRSNFIKSMTTALSTFLNICWLTLIMMSSIHHPVHQRATFYYLPSHWCCEHSCSFTVGLVNTHINAIANIINMSWKHSWTEKWHSGTSCDV